MTENTCKPPSNTEAMPDPMLRTYSFELKSDRRNHILTDNDTRLRFRKLYAAVAAQPEGTLVYVLSVEEAAEYAEYCDLLEQKDSSYLNELGLQ